MPLQRQQIISALSLPTTVRTTSLDGDYIFMIGVDGVPYKITKANLFAGLSSNSSGSGGSSTGTTGTTGSGTTSSGSSGSTSLIYTSDGDTKGLFYWLGTNKGAVAWTNPDGSLLAVTASSTEFGSPDVLVNRIADEFYTANAANSWVSFQILSGGKLNCNYYSIETRSRNIDYYPRNWKLQGCNDGVMWIDIDTQVNNTSLNAVSQWLSLPVASSVPYSWFRLLANGNDSSGYPYFCLGEIELYGIYIP